MRQNQFFPHIYIVALATAFPLFHSCHELDEEMNITAYENDGKNAGVEILCQARDAITGDKINSANLSLMNDAQKELLAYGMYYTTETNIPSAHYVLKATANGYASVFYQLNTPQQGGYNHLFVPEIVEMLPSDDSFFTAIDNASMVSSTFDEKVDLSKEYGNSSKSEKVSDIDVPVLMGSRVKNADAVKSAIAALDGVGSEKAKVLLSQWLSCHQDYQAGTAYFSMAYIPSQVVEIYAKCKYEILSYPMTITVLVDDVIGHTITVDMERVSSVTYQLVGMRPDHVEQEFYILTVSNKKGTDGAGSSTSGYDYKSPR